MALTPMDRRTFVLQLALEHAQLERANPGRKITPLDERFVFSVGGGYVRAGQYRPRGDWRSIDKRPFARDARRALPYARRLLDS